MRSRQMANTTRRDVLDPQWSTSKCLNIESACERIPAGRRAYFAACKCIHLDFFGSIFIFTGWWLVAAEYQLSFPYLPSFKPHLGAKKNQFNLQPATVINFGYFNFVGKQLFSTPSISGILFDSFKLLQSHCRWEKKWKNGPGSRYEARASCGKIARLLKKILMQWK